MLYAARSDAQKAADAASLAGAKYFLDQGSLPTTLTQAMRDESKAYAKAIGTQNSIRGGTIQPSEIVINDSDIQLISTNPPVFEVTSRVQRTGLSTYLRDHLWRQRCRCVSNSRGARFQIIWYQRISDEF